MAGHRRPFLRGRVPVPDGDADAQPLREERHAAQHVAVQGAKGRDVQAARRGRFLAKEVLEDRQEGGFRLSDPRGGDEEHVRPGQDPRDRADLRLRELVDAEGPDRVEDGGIEAQGLHEGRLKGSSD